MEKVRIGNDLRVNFSVYRNGEPESFDGASNIVTKLVNEAYNKLITHTYTITGNIVQFDIDALQLTQCGKCRLFISYTKGGDYTVDSPAFELVNYTDQTGGTEVIGVEIVSINISGDIGINRDGLSAYEVWESYPGNEGKTIEQYFTWLRENPTKIDLNGLNSNIDKLHFNPDTLVQLTNIGDVRYSTESRTLEVKVSDTVSIQLGQEMQTRVKNNAGAQINNGQMVYIDSAVGANPLAKIASTANADIAQRTFGMATENIPANGFGAITTEGLVRDINTAAFPEGTMLWLGANGSVTNIEPVAPASKISVGMVLRSNTNNGVIYVKIRAIARNQKLSDVYAPTLTGGDILRWNSTTLRFEVFNITAALSAKTDASRSIIAGNGLTGGGTLASDRTINVVNTDDSIVVSADSIKVNTNNTLTSTSITQPLSANQGKVLNEKAVQLETDLNGRIMNETLSAIDGTTIKGKYIMSNGDLGNLGAYDIIKYTVLSGDVLELMCTYNVGASKKYAIYNSTTVFDSTTVIKIGEKVEPSYNDTIDIDVIGSSLTFIAVKYESAGIVTLQRKTYENRIDKIELALGHFQNKIAYNISNNIVDIAFKYGINNDFKVQLKPKGGNGIFDFFSISVLNNSNAQVSQDFSNYELIASYSTDWHMPFQVRAVNNIDGDNKEGTLYRIYFTGGNHQYNNRGSGSTPTARLDNVRFFANGREVTNESGYTSHIEIRWTNYVQGYNTTKADGSGREILQENHVIKFDGVKWITEIELIPLEDIIMNLWYGLGLVYEPSYKESFKFKGASSRKRYTSYTSEVSCESRECRSIELSGLEHAIEVGIDENFDLGKRNMIYSYESGCFFQQYSKAYHRIISHDQNLNEGSSYYLSGFYKFFPANNVQL